MRVEVQESHFQIDYFKTLFTQNVECTRMISYLLLQLDNAASDNKNRYVFMFLSLLTALGVV